MSKKAIIGISVAVAAVVLLAMVGGVLAFGIGGYNTLVDQQLAAETKASDIDVQLTRRSDLIPNLVNTVKGYAAHETEVYTAIADARAKLAGSTSLEDKAEANSELDSAISRLLVVVEQYPELKASQQFIALQDELAGAENRIAVARRDYNQAVQSYNASLRKFPSSLIGSIFGFEKMELFQADESDKDAPVVDFNG